ncbi:uncharacterized protein V1518DRAFT_409247 [Limtongia smithiae]|uniref:uncharacterized protein n=1 Tax=Limtongia smithiae TaxID=1125753 RepID=UPI0034CF5D5B
MLSPEPSGATPLLAFTASDVVDTPRMRLRVFVDRPHLSTLLPGNPTVSDAPSPASTLPPPLLVPPSPYAAAKFVHITSAATNMRALALELAERYARIYHRPLRVKTLRDEQGFDLDDDYMVAEVFRDFAIVRVLADTEEISTTASLSQSSVAPLKRALSIESTGEADVHPTPAKRQQLMQNSKTSVSPVPKAPALASTSATAITPALAKRNKTPPNDTSIATAPLSSAPAQLAKLQESPIPSSPVPTATHTTVSESPSHHVEVPNSQPEPVAPTTPKPTVKPITAGAKQLVPAVKLATRVSATDAPTQATAPVKRPVSQVDKINKKDSKTAEKAAKAAKVAEEKAAKAAEKAAKAAEAKAAKAAKTAEARASRAARAAQEKAAKAERVKAEKAALAKAEKEKAAETPTPKQAVPKKDDDNIDHSDEDSATSADEDDETDSEKSSAAVTNTDATTVSNSSVRVASPSPPALKTAAKSKFALPALPPPPPPPQLKVSNRISAAMKPRMPSSPAAPKSSPSSPARTSARTAKPATHAVPPHHQNRISAEATALSSETPSTTRRMSSSPSDEDSESDDGSNADIGDSEEYSDSEHESYRSASSQNVAHTPSLAASAEPAMAANPLTRVSGLEKRIPSFRSLSELANLGVPDVRESTTGIRTASTPGRKVAPGIKGRTVTTREMSALGASVKQKSTFDFDLSVSESDSGSDSDSAEDSEPEDEGSTIPENKRASIVSDQARRKKRPSSSLGALFSTA